MALVSCSECGKQISDAAASGTSSILIKLLIPFGRITVAKNWLLAAALIGLSLPQTALAEGDAMFGLRWGQSVESVKEQGVSMTPPTTMDNLIFYVATSLPKDLNNAEKYTLVFDETRGLVKLVAYGKDVSDDILGSDGKARFAQLKAALTEKYGKPTNGTETVGITLYKESSEFYQCLAYTGCGLWWALFETPEATIVLALKGVRRGVGHIEITAESRPAFSEAIEENKRREAAKEADAL